ncbi:hypothetical protein [Aureimonas pseudogalii]|nr:hypothetical protein [Aureimonas pseudogalii]
MNTDKPSPAEGRSRRERRTARVAKDRTKVSAKTPLPALRRRHSEELANVMLRANDVRSVTRRPETFEWIDGLTGKPHVHVPAVAVVWACGHKTFVDATSAAKLRADPTLAGVRGRIEAECLARGATYEIWTEEELRKNLGVVQVLRPASSEERAAYAESLRTHPSAGPPSSSLVGDLAARLGLADVRAVRQGWVARSSLTGIPMALLCDMEVDPVTRMLVWKPRNAAANQAGGTLPSASSAHHLAPSTSGKS